MRWAQEDLLEEQKDGARAAADRKKGMLGALSELDSKGEEARGALDPELSGTFLILFLSLTPSLLSCQTWTSC